MVNNYRMSPAIRVGVAVCFSFSCIHYNIIYIKRRTLVAEPVANEVLVAGVHQHSDPRCELIRDHLLVVMHPVTAQLEPNRDKMVAVAPLMPLDTKCGDDLGALEVGRDIAEVVAQRRNGAFNAHVVRIPTR